VLAITYCDNHDTRFGANTASNSKRLV
jgi:hypothetical protein